MLCLHCCIFCKVHDSMVCIVGFVTNSKPLSEDSLMSAVSTKQISCVETKNSHSSDKGKCRNWWLYIVITVRDMQGGQ